MVKSRPRWPPSITTWGEIATALAGIATTAVGGLTTTQIKGLSTTAAAAFSTTQVGALTTTQVVTLTATPDELSDFVGWSGACEGTGPTCTLPMDRAKGATATFARKRFDLVVEKTGTGEGKNVT